MNANLLTLAQDALGSDFSRLAGQFLGESQGATQSALSSLLPAVLGRIAQNGATPQGASGLLSMINGANLDVASLGNVAGLFGSGGSGVNALLKSGTSSLVPGLFGDKAGPLVNALSSASGIKTTSATSLLAMVVPLVLIFLKKFIGDKGLNAGSLASLLSGQGANLKGALDGRMTSAMGFASPAAFLGSLGGQAADTAVRAGAAVAGGAAAATTATKSGLMRWLPWVIGAALVLFLWNQITGSSKPAPAPAPTAAVTAPAPAPAAAPVAVLLPAKVYFDVGAATIGADGSKTLGAVADLVKKDGLKVVVTGYTDRTGDLAKNEELAKSRASAVRDALKAAGVAETSLEMRPPMLVEVGAAGSDAEARRVEISRP
jgi:outer membrane protein OmpA-like peptidoglycan-associated protein